MKALAIRRVMKRAKPVFRKQDANKRKKLSRTSYKKPDGYSSGQRKRKRGKVAIPLVGFSSPRAVKGLHASGKKVVMVKNFKDLKLVDKESIGVISASVGMRKRLELLKSKATCAIPTKVDTALLRPTDVTLQIPDTSKFESETGWQPKYSFEETVEHLLEHCRREVAREIAEKELQ